MTEKRLTENDGAYTASRVRRNVSAAEVHTDLEEESRLSSKEEAAPCSKDGGLGLSGPSPGPPAEEGGSVCDEGERGAACGVCVCVVAVNKTYLDTYHETLAGTPSHHPSPHPPTYLPHHPN